MASRFPLPSRRSGVTWTALVIGELGRKHLAFEQSGSRSRFASPGRSRSWRVTAAPVIWLRERVDPPAPPACCMCLRAWSARSSEDDIHYLVAEGANFRPPDIADFED